MPRAAVGPADTLSHTEQGWEKKKKNSWSCCKCSQTPIIFPRARMLPWDSLYCKLFHADAPLIIFKALLVFLGLQMALGSAAGARLEQVLRGRSQKTPAQKGCCGCPLALQILHPSRAPLPRGWARGNPSASRGRQQKKLDSSKIKPESVAEHCLKFPRDFKDDEGC